MSQRKAKAGPAAGARGRPAAAGRDCGDHWRGLSRRHVDTTVGYVANTDKKVWSLYGV